MTASPLVYFFAGVACVLAAWFVFGGLLALRHARTRGDRANDLRSFIGTSRSRMSSAQVSATGVSQRAAHVTIGDLVRDERLLKAAGDGMAARRQSLKPRPTS
jgi:hypothetical protein